MSDVNWDPAVWKAINDDVVAEISKCRIAQQVFPTTALDQNPQSVPNEVIIFDPLSMPESAPKLLVTLSVEFSLTQSQVDQEGELNTCKTLSRMAAKALALAEDTVFFQGTDGAKRLGVVKAINLDSADEGLLGQASPQDADDADPTRVSKPIAVKPVDRPGVLYGENVFAAVAAGIAKLTSKSQAPKYALLLPIKVYADTYAPPGPASLVTTAERIKPLVEGGFLGTATLPEHKGLLVALAGDPTVLYVGLEANVQFVRQEGAAYFFQALERIQFDVRDPRAFVLLDFQLPVDDKPKGRQADAK